MSRLVPNDRLRRLRRLKEVPRWNAVPVIRQENVDQHCFHVAYIAVWVAENFASVQPPLQDILWWAIIHDEPESVTGDIPSPAKTVLGQALKDFEERRGYGVAPNTQTKYIVKVADCLQALIKVREDQMLGNQGLTQIHADILDKLEKAWVLFHQYCGQGLHTTTGENVLNVLWDILHPEHHPVLDEIAAMTEGDIPF